MKKFLLLFFPILSFGDPVVTAQTADHISHASANIYFTTSEDWVFMRTWYTVDGTSCASAGTRVMQPSDYPNGAPQYRQNINMRYILTNLKPNSSIHVCTEVHNGNGNWQGGSEYSFTTLPIVGIHPTFPIAPNEFHPVFPDISAYTVYNVTATGGDCSSLYTHFNTAISQQTAHGSVIKVPNIETAQSCLTNTSGGGILWPDTLSQDVVTLNSGDVAATGGRTFHHAGHGLTQGQEIVFDAQFSDLPGTISRAAGADPELCQSVVPGYHYFVDFNHISVTPVDNFGLSCNAPDGTNDVHGRASIPMIFLNVGSGSKFYYYKYPRDTLYWIIIQSNTDDAQFLSKGSRIDDTWKPKMGLISNPYFNYFQFTGTRNVSTPATFSLGGTDPGDPMMLGKIWIRHLVFDHPLTDTRATQSADGLSQAPYLVISPSNSDIVIDQNIFNAHDAPYRYTNMFGMEGHNVYFGNNQALNLTVYQSAYDGLATSGSTGNPVFSIGAGTHYLNGKYKYIQSGSTTITLAGTWSGSGSGTVYATLASPSQLVIETPTGVTASCSPACVNVVNGSAPGFSSCNLTGNWPKNGDNKITVGPIACMTFQNGPTVQIQGLVNANTLDGTLPPGVDGCQCFLTDRGPGPVMMENNMISGMGNMYHVEDANDGYSVANHPVWQKENIVLLKNHIRFDDKWKWHNPFGGSTLSNGLAYRSRSGFETKGAGYEKLEGNEFEGQYVNTATDGPFALTPVCDQTIHDVLIISNWFHHAGNVGQLGSSTQSACMQTAPANHFAMINNLANDINGFKYWIPYGGKNQGTGWFLQGTSGEDYIVDFNTVDENTGAVPGFLYMIYMLPEGMQMRNNIVWIQNGFYSGCDDIMACQNVSDTQLFAADNTYYTQKGTAMSDLWRNHDITGNIYLGNASAGTIGGWLSYGGTIPSTPSDISQMGYGNPGNRGTSAYRFQPSGAFVNSSGGKNPGADIDKLENALGQLKSVGWTNNGTNSFKVNWLAPDAKGCDVDYGTDLINSFTRISASAFNQGMRSVTITGANKTAINFRINCQVEQPTGVGFIN